jgi:hypothetical protein
LAYVPIAPDNDCGLLDPVASPVLDEGQPQERLGRATCHVAAFAKRGFFKTYELESHPCVLEVQLPGISTPQAWLY